MERARGKGVQLEWKRDYNNNATSRMLVGRVISKTKIGYGIVKEAVTTAWKVRGELQIKMIGFNLYIFSFSEIDDADMIQKESPWIVRNYILSLSRRKPFISDNEVKVNHCQFWVQFHNLPPEARMEQNVRVMAEIVRRVIEVKSPDDARFSHRSFGRARVEVEVDKPLVPGFLSPQPDEELEDVWIRVKYEKLSRFCYNCGRLGHESRVCEEEDLDGNEEGYDASMSTHALREGNTVPASRTSGRPAEKTQEEEDKGANVSNCGNTSKMSFMDENGKGSFGQRNGGAANINWGCHFGKAVSAENVKNKGEMTELNARGKQKGGIGHSRSQTGEMDSVWTNGGPVDRGAGIRIQELIMDMDVGSF